MQWGGLVLAPAVAFSAGAQDEVKERGSAIRKLLLCLVDPNLRNIVRFLIMFLKTFVYFVIAFVLALILFLSSSVIVFIFKVRIPCY